MALVYGALIGRKREAYKQTVAEICIRHIEIHFICGMFFNFAFIFICSINEKSSQIRIMALHRTGDKPQQAIYAITYLCPSKHKMYKLSTSFKYLIPNNTLPKTLTDVNYWWTSIKQAIQIFRSVVSYFAMQSRNVTFTTTRCFLFHSIFRVRWAMRYMSVLINNFCLKWTSGYSCPTEVSSNLIFTIYI